MTLGNKALNLLSLKNDFGFEVPDFVVVDFAHLFENFETTQTALEKQINAWLKGRRPFTDVEKLVARGISKLKLDKEAIAEIYALVASKGWQKVSVRTSAALEDGAGNSFAGQYESFLDISPTRDEIAKHALASFKSVIAPKVLNYARSQRIRDFKIAGSIVIQEMFFGDVSGVLFSENGSGEIAIAYNRSWRNTVVDGESAETLSIGRDRLSDRNLPPQIRQLCQQALAIEAKVGKPVDIEFAYDSKRLALLQYRPVTVANLDYLLEWDATNISENYPGITLPLTYSFIRSMYAGVYPAFLRKLGTPQRLLDANTNSFENMLGYLSGHVYYRITSWYETVKLLPGRSNQEAFEAMLNPVKKRGAADKKRMDARSLVAVLRFVWLLLRSESLSRKFKKRVAEVLNFYEGYQVDYVNAAALFASIRQSRKALLEEWSTSILNDVKLMVFHGILKRVFFKSADVEYLNFLQGLSDRASIKPLEGITKLGKVVEKAMHTERVTTITALQRTKSHAQVIEAAKSYINDFGARTPDELKLENERLTDRIGDVLELAIKAAGSNFSVSTAKTQTQWPAQIKTWQRPILGYVAKETRRAIDWRERFRFNRAQMFNLSRDAYNVIGAALAAENIIATSRDIFWLTEQEVDELVNGHAWQLDAKATVKTRKAQFKKYAKTDMALAVHGAGRIAPLHLNQIRPAAGALAGTGVAPGEINAKVVVATEFDANLDVRGKILVVHHIDPGWTLLFTQAAGIVAERGNALSHAAIIAREIGIPAVVAAPGATTALKTGDRITINGVTGAITRAKN